jgi:hypothetical protein
MCAKNTSFGRSAAEPGSSDVGQPLRTPEAVEGSKGVLARATLLDDLYLLPN